MGYPTDSTLRGLARVTFHNDIPPQEFDLRAVPSGTDVLEVSDWHRRHKRSNNQDGNIDRAADALAESIARRIDGRGRR